VSVLSVNKETLNIWALAA